MPRPILGQTTVGFFGKLPSTGDFVTRGLQQGVRPFLDQWLTRGLNDPKDWPEGGLRAIVGWGNFWLTLLILPSNDKPRRKFPLAVCQTTPAAPDQESADVWCSSVLELATKAIATPMLADDLMQALAKIENPVQTAEPDQSSDLIWHNGALPVAVSEGGLALAINRLLNSG